jgi:hypothetical protein
MEKFKLRIWPDHCLIGTDGHAIEPNIQEAIREWDIHHYAKTVKHIHKVTHTRQFSSYKVSEIGIIYISGNELLDRNVQCYRSGGSHPVGSNHYEEHRAAKCSIPVRKSKCKMCYTSVAVVTDDK